MNGEVHGCQIALHFEVDFDDIADELEMSVEDVREAWNSENLKDLICESLSVDKITDLARESIEVEVGSGYY